MAEYNHEKYYWIKLKQSLMTSKAVDFLMSQKDGANYVVLYQCLCLKTVNQNGELADRIGEIIVPYDEQKIQRETKWFTIDTIRVAMALYRQLGLIYEQDNGILKISDFDDLIGSQTVSAYKKEIQLKQRKELQLKQWSENLKQRVEQRVENFPPELDIRDKEIDKEKKSIEKKKGTTTLNDFLSEYNISMDNYSERINEMDFDALKKAYSESKWLQTNIISLSKICKEYERIVGGYYRDYTKPNAFENSHHYSKEQLDSLVDNIDDIDFN